MLARMAAIERNPNHKNAESLLRQPKLPPQKALLDARLIWRWRSHPCVIRDTGLRGFACRIGKTGAASFVMTYRDAEGRQREFTLDAIIRPEDTGKPPADQRISDDPADYREKARVLKKQLKDDRENNDPLFKRQHALDEAAAKRRDGHTFADVAAQWIERRADKRTIRNDISLLTQHIIPALGQFSIARLGHDSGRAAFSAAVRAQFKTISATAPYQANRVLSLTSALWNFASKGVQPKRGRGGRIDGLHWLPEGTTNPIADIASEIRNIETERSRWLNAGEMAALVHYLRDHPGQPQRQVLTIALTGARRGEVLGAAWEQIDFATGYWHRPASIMKNGRDADPFPLSGPLLAMLKTMHDEAGRPTNGPLWPGVDRGLMSLRRYWRRLQTDCNVPGVRFHDLRRTLASLSLQSGTSIAKISKTLGHHSIGVTEKHYGFLADDPIRTVVETYADQLMTGDASNGAVVSGPAALNRE